MVGELNQKQIEYVLRSQVVGRVGCYADGQVYIVPVTYVYEEPYIYGHTKAGLKIKMMRQNPKVCFQVDAIQNMANWQSVIVYGEYEELRGDDSQEALQLLKNRITPLLVSETSMPVGTLDIHQSVSASKITQVTYRIRIAQMTGRYEKK